MVMFKPASQPTLASPLETLLAVWSAFLGNWKSLVRISVIQFASLLFSVPAALYVFGRFEASGSVVAQAPENPMVHVLLLLLSLAASAAVAGFTHPALIATIYMKLVGKDLAPRKAFERSREVFWRYLLVLVGIGAAISLASLLPIPILGAALAVAVGLFLMFSEQAVVLEDKKALDAFKRSVELVRGRFWAVLWRFLVVAGVFAAVMAAASFLFVWKPLDLLDVHLMPVFRQRWYLILFSAVGTLLSTFALPLFLLIQTIFYAELRKHKTPS